MSQDLLVRIQYWAQFLSLVPDDFCRVQVIFIQAATILLLVPNDICPVQNNVQAGRQQSQIK